MSVRSWKHRAGRRFVWSFGIRLGNSKDTRENWHRLLLDPFPRTKFPPQPTRVTWYQATERTKRANGASVLGISVERGFQKGPKYTCPRQRGPGQEKLSVWTVGAMGNYLTLTGSAGESGVVQSQQSSQRQPCRISEDCNRGKLYCLILLLEIQLKGQLLEDPGHEPDLLLSLS